MKAGLARAALVIALLRLFLAAAPAEAALSYQTLDNPGDPRFTELTGINNSGLITGFFGSDLRRPFTTGFTFQASAFGALKPAPGPKWGLAGANNTETLVGFYSPTNLGPRTDQTQAFFAQAGAVQTVDINLGAAPRKFEQLSGVDDHNLAVGFYTAADGNTHGYTYQIGSGALAAFDFPKSVTSDANGINNAGEIVGDFAGSDGILHGNLHVGGSFLQLDAPRALETIAYGVNNHGLVVGQEDDGIRVHGFLFDARTGQYVEPLDPLGGSSPRFRASMIKARSSAIIWIQWVARMVSSPRI
jgi:hypothetical protein